MNLNDIFDKLDKFVDIEDKLDTIITIYDIDENEFF